MLVEYVPGTFSFEKHTRSCAVRNKEPVDLKFIKVVQEINYLQINYNDPISANLDLMLVKRYCCSKPCHKKLTEAEKRTRTCSH